MCTSGQLDTFSAVVETDDGSRDYHGPAMQGAAECLQSACIALHVMDTSTLLFLLVQEKEGLSSHSHCLYGFDTSELGLLAEPLDILFHGIKSALEVLFDPSRAVWATVDSVTERKHDIRKVTLTVVPIIL